MALILTNSIFYHIPKTGGTWVSRVIRMSSGVGTQTKRNYHISDVNETIYWKRFVSELLHLNRAHLTPWSIPEEIKKNKFSFTFVRKPLSWLESFWMDRYHADKNTHNLGYFLHDFAYDDDFNIFLYNTLKMFPEGLVTTIYKCYLGRDGKDLDFVGKQENLRKDLITALTMAGEIVDSKYVLQRAELNTAQDKKGFKERPVASDTMKKLINEREKWILDTFYK